MKKLMLIMALFVVSPVVKSQENTYLVPERANMGINAAVQIAKQLKERGYDKIAVVYMNTSDLCALTAASLVASLKTLGVDAYYLKGADPDLPLSKSNIKGFNVQQGKVEMVSVKVKGLEIAIEPEPQPKKETPKTPTKKRTR
jgi:hypothetical protein